MTVSTYSELLTALANWTHRSDLSGRDAEAVDNFEAKVSRRLKLKDMEASTTSTMVSGTATISVPDGMTDLRSIIFVPVSGAIRKLEYITPEQADAKEYADEGIPRWYTFVGGAIRLYPTPDAAYSYTLKYYKRVVALGSTTGYTTNWLLSNHPDLYLYGSLVELCAFTGDDPRLMVWKQAVEEGLKELERADRKERFKAPVAQFDSELTGGMTRNIETDGE